MEHFFSFTTPSASQKVYVLYTRKNVAIFGGLLIYRNYSTYTQHCLPNISDENTPRLWIMLVTWRALTAILLFFYTRPVDLHLPAKRLIIINI